MQGRNLNRGLLKDRSRGRERRQISRRKMIIEARRLYDNRPSDQAVFNAREQLKLVF